MAGAGGFEPPHGGIKIRCLTAWLRPNASSDGRPAGRRHAEHNGARLTDQRSPRHGAARSDGLVLSHRIMCMMTPSAVASVKLETRASDGHGFGHRNLAACASVEKSSDLSG